MKYIMLVIRTIDFAIKLKLTKKEETEWNIHYLRS